VRAGPYLESLRTSPIVTARELTAGRPIVILSPHPDDETLGAGGLIAETCAAGQTVDVVVVTDGAGSHLRSKQYPRQRLVDLRYSEVHKAGAELGLMPDRVTFLGLPDTMAPSSGPEFDAAVLATRAVVRRSGAGALFVTWEEDPHCDHKASAKLAKAVAELTPDLKIWAYPIWGWHVETGAEMEHCHPNAVRIDISKQMKRKLSAIQAHASQMTDLIDDDPDGFHFDDKSLAPFLGRYEYFMEVQV
jgi:LmbE family N-acetylglucosaminyl deacetylase